MTETNSELTADKALSEDERGLNWPMEVDPLLFMGAPEAAYQRSTSINWWHLEIVTVLEAAALSFGIDPNLALDYIDGGNCGTMQRRFFYNKVRNITDAIMLGKIKTVDFDSGKEPDLNTRLVSREASKFLGFINSDSKQDGDKCELEKPAAKTANKESTSKEYQTLLKLVLGMAKDAYGYDPNNPRNKATGDKSGSIKAAMDRQGISIDPDTIRKFLNEAKELL